MALSIICGYLMLPGKTGHIMLYSYQLGNIWFVVPDDTTVGQDRRPRERSEGQTDASLTLSSNQPFMSYSSTSVPPRSNKYQLAASKQWFCFFVRLTDRSHQNC